MRSSWRIVLRWHLTGMVIGSLAFGIVIGVSSMMVQIEGRGLVIGMLGTAAGLAVLLYASLLTIPFLFGWLALARRFPRLERDPWVRFGILGGVAVLLAVRSQSALQVSFVSVGTLGWLIGPRLLVRSLRGSLVATDATPGDGA